MIGRDSFRHRARPPAREPIAVTLAGAVMRGGLIHVYEIVTHPVLLGGGTPFLTALDGWVHLNLVETRMFPGGVFKRTRNPTKIQHVKAVLRAIRIDLRRIQEIQRGRDSGDRASSAGPRFDFSSLPISVTAAF